MQPQIRILIAEDHDVSIRGIKDILIAHPDIRILDALDRGEHLLSSLQQYQPDVLLLDLKMEPNFDATQALRAILLLEKRPKIIIISAHLDYYIATNHAELGVSAYLLKEDVLSDKLPRAIRAVCNDNLFFSDKVRDAINQVEDYLEKRPPILSSDQYEVLVMMVMGLTSQEIATRTNRHTTAVYGIEQRIRKRLGVATRDQIIIKAIADKFIPIEVLGKEIN